MENIEAAMKRIPPHSIEAEQAVLGAMLMNKDAVMVASEIITGEDFYQTAYGIIFDSVVDLFKAGKPADLITLQEKLKEKNVPPEISSMEFVKDLLERAGVMVTPGSAFGPSGEGYVRIALVQEEEVIDAAAEAVKKSGIF